MPAQPCPGDNAGRRPSTPGDIALIRQRSPKTWTPAEIDHVFAWAQHNTKAERRPSTPGDIAPILQRPPATWTPAESDRVFAWLLHDKMESLVQFAYQVLRTYNAGATLEDALDAVAEKIGDAWKSRCQFNPAFGSFLHWVYVMLRKHCWRAGQRAATRHEVPLETNVQNQDGSAIQQDRPDPATLSPERAVQIRQLQHWIDRLPERSRSALKMQYGIWPYAHAMSLTEIAQELSLTSNHVKQIVFRAKQQLKVLLEEEEGRA